MGEGLELEIDGEWKNNKKFGLQYEVSYYQWSIWGLWV